MYSSQGVGGARQQATKARSSTATCTSDYSQFARVLVTLLFPMSVPDGYIGVEILSLLLFRLLGNHSIFIAYLTWRLHTSVKYSQGVPSFHSITMTSYDSNLSSELRGRTTSCSGLAWISSLVK